MNRPKNRKARLQAACKKLVGKWVRFVGDFSDYPHIHGVQVYMVKEVRGQRVLTESFEGRVPMYFYPRDVVLATDSEIAFWVAKRIKGPDEIPF